MVASPHKRSLMRYKTIPKFRSDREAAAFWDRHASTSYLSDLEEVTVRIRPALRKQIAARARARKGPRAQTADESRSAGDVMVRLAPAKLAAVRTVAVRTSVRCEDLIERWITDGLKRAVSRSGSSGVASPLRAGRRRFRVLTAGASSTGPARRP